MPYPEEHSCRLLPPANFNKFRRVNCHQKHDGKCIDSIFGINNKKSKIQALRYKTKVWDESDAKDHCKSRKGTFHKATGESKDEEEIMAIKLNSRGNANARQRINAGNIDDTSPWSFSAGDGDKILGENNWAKYSEWHLGIETEAEKKSKAHYKYPFGKNGKVYRSGLTAIRQRAGQQKQNDIFEVAGRLIKLIDKDEKGDELYDFDVVKRTFQADEIRVARGGDSESLEIIGHAAVFDELGDGYWFKEKIARGAFEETIKIDDIRALFNHDPSIVLGRNTSGTLTLREDKKGLAISIAPPDTTLVSDMVLTPIERGDITQMSFAFRTLEDKWEHNEGKEDDIRTLLKVKLYDVSPVTFPFYEGTDVALRSFERFMNETNNYKPKARLRNLMLADKIGD